MPVPLIRRRLIVAAVVAAAVATPILAIAGAWLGEGTVVGSVVTLGSARLWLLLAGLGGLVVLVKGRGGTRVLGALPPILTALAVTGAPAATVAATADQPPVLRVAALNLAKGGEASDEVLGRSIAALDADVVCISEAGDYDWRPEFDVRGMAARHGFTVVGDDETRALVRAPLLASRIVPLAPGPARRPLVMVDVAGRGAVVRIACVHLIPPLLWQRDSVDLGAASGGGPGAVVAARAAQGHALAAVLDEAHVDVVAGDFNVVSWGRLLRDLGDHDYSDALADQGFLSATFTPFTWLLGRRLDHILVRSTLRQVASAIVDDVGSDHAAVFVDLARASP